MKALILAGGRGSRLGESTKEINKCMLEIKGKPLIEYSFDCATSLAQIDELIVVVSYKAEVIIEKYGTEYKGRKITYVTQENRKGVVHAIECAGEALGDDDFILMLGDEFLVNPKYRGFIKEFLKDSAFGLCGVVEVEDRELVKKTYSIVESAVGNIVRLVEKPSKPASNIMGTGNCVFKNKILNYIAVTPINQKRGEKELPDLIQAAIDDGNIIKPFIICKDYINVNFRDELDKSRSYFSHL